MTDAYGGNTPPFDPFMDFDFRRDERKNMIACRKCGAPEPVRLAPEGCDECTDFDRCFYCDRWVFEDAEGWWQTGYRWVDDAASQAEVMCCDVCWGKIE